MLYVIFIIMSFFTSSAEKELVGINFTKPQSTFTFWLEVLSTKTFSSSVVLHEEAFNGRLGVSED